MSETQLNMSEYELFKPVYSRKSKTKEQIQREAQEALKTGDQEAIKTLVESALKTIKKVNDEKDERFLKELDLSWYEKK